MIYIETGSSTPAVNLAFEEYFLKSKDLGEDVCMLWRNEPVVVVGRFQNTLEEINYPLADALSIPIIRRISGGGAVYHDLGNLCFSFILHDARPEIIDKSKYARPLVQALAQLGFPVEVSKRNDFLIDGKKFSGNAMVLHKNRLLFHGTLLYDANLGTLQNVLKAPHARIELKGIKSNKSSVTNIKQYMKEELSILAFKQSLKQIIFEDQQDAYYDPTFRDLEAIGELVKHKYSTWEWNYGHNPPTKIRLSGHLPGGTIEAYLELNKGFIKTCQMQGDFPGLDLSSNALSIYAISNRTSAPLLSASIDTSHLNTTRRMNSCAG